MGMSQKRAREIMGGNMFGIEEAIQYFGVNPSKQQLAILADVPFIESTLEQCEETHILTAVLPLSIIKIRSKAKSGLFYNQSWYNKESFAKDCGGASWQLIRKTAAPNSTLRTWQEQQALLGSNEEVPNARVMIYVTIGQYLATGERIFERIYVRVRCSDAGSRVIVGFFDSGGLIISSGRDECRYGYIGAASAQKPD